MNFFAQRIKSFVFAVRYIPPVWIDGIITVSIAVLLFWQNFVNQDEVRTAFTASTLLFIKFTIGSIAQLCSALQLFRSKALADHQKKKEIDSTPSP